MKKALLTLAILASSQFAMATSIATLEKSVEFSIRTVLLQDKDMQNYGGVTRSEAKCDLQAGNKIICTVMSEAGDDGGKLYSIMTVEVKQTASVLDIKKISENRQAID